MKRKREKKIVKYHLYLVAFEIVGQFYGYYAEEEEKQEEKKHFNNIIVKASRDTDMSVSILFGGCVLVLLLLLENK